MAREKIESGSKGDATRVRILEAAASAFQRNGYRETRLEDIAAAANMQAGSLYYHFASREDLVEALLRAGLESTATLARQRLANVPSGSSHLDHIAELIKAHLASILQDRYASATLRIVGQVPMGVRHRLIVDQRRYSNRWQRHLEAARDAGEMRGDLNVSVVRNLILGGLNLSSEWYQQDRGLTIDELGDQFASMFFEGLAVRRQATRHATPPIIPDVPTSANSAHALRIGQERILDAAAKTFRERGYAATRLTDIAAAAGLEVGTLYHHFRSRETLLAELMRTAWEMTSGYVRASVAAVPAGAMEIDRLSAAVTAHLVSVLRSNGYTSALVNIVSQVPDEVRVHSLADQRQYIRFWRELLESAAAAGEIRADLNLSAMQMMIMNALNWTVEWYRPGDNLGPHEIADQFTSIVLDGLAKTRNPKARSRPREHTGKP